MRAHSVQCSHILESDLIVKKIVSLSSHNKNTEVIFKDFINPYLVEIENSFGFEQAGVILYYTNKLNLVSAVFVDGVQVTPPFFAKIGEVSPAQLVEKIKNKMKESSRLDAVSAFRKIMRDPDFRDSPDFMVHRAGEIERKRGIMNWWRFRK